MWNLKITVLGSGTILSGPQRKPSAFLLESGDQLALLDMGPGILQQLATQNIDLLKPDAVFLTHFHLDHCSDVFPYLMSRYLLDNQSNKQLKMYGPFGLNNWYAANASLQGRWLRDCPPEIIEICGDILWTNYTVKTHPSAHTENSVAYRFEGYTTIFFSGDTGYSQDLINFALNADLGIVECSHPDDNPIHGHLTPRETGRFAQLAGLKKLAVCHMYPKNDTSDLSEQIAKEYKGKISILKDFDIL